MLTKRRRAMALFVAAELLLAMAIPFLAIAGYHTLLDSRAGRFVEEPSPSDPGWRAIVDPSPVHAVVEVEQNRLTGVVLLAGHDEQFPGTAILVPGTLHLDGAPLSARPPAEAVQLLGSALRLRIPSFDVLDEWRWPRVLADKTYDLENPDPVAGLEGQEILSVGAVQIGGEEAALFVGRPSPGADPITVSTRRLLLWSALLADPPSAEDEIAQQLRDIGGPGAQTVELPLMAIEPNPSPDLEATETLVREVVPVPAGANPGDRIQVRVIDRTGTADLATIASEVASNGAEVIEIGNAREFDGGETLLVVPLGAEGPGLTELAMLMGAATVSDSEGDSEAVVTLLIGVDFAPGR